MDARQHNTVKTFSPLYNKLQGPSLLAWNNSVFTESDLEGLINLGVGSKREETAKIGHFGVGFNSVYHFTDAPQLISNFADYVIFDPLGSHFVDLEITNPGHRISDVRKYFESTKNDDKAVYSDVLMGFKVDVDGLELEGSTMFRLALRTNAGEISNVIHTINDMETIMKNFMDSNDDNLIFLKNVKSNVVSI